MELAHYLSMLRRWWWLLLAGVLVTAGASYAISKTLTPVYRSTATLLVNQTQVPGIIAYNDILASQQLTQTYAQLINQEPVLQEVIDKLDLPVGLEELNGMIHVKVVTGTQLLKLSVEDADPMLATNIANTAASVFIEQNTANSLSRPGEVSVTEMARIPTSPVKPNIMMNTILAAAVGLILAAGIAFLIDYLDDTVKSPEDLEASGLSLLGSVARFRRRQNPAENLMVGSASRQRSSEAYRVLRTNVQFSTIDRPGGQTLLVTSANRREGKSTTAANLALVMAQTGKRVVLIDSDLRQPAIHRFFGLGNERGLTDLMLSPQLGLDSCIQTTHFEKLSVLASGTLPPNPSELLASDRFGSVLDMLRKRADVIILDSPPALAAADASILASKVDSTMLVVDSRRTRVATLRSVREVLEKSKTHLLGAVLNKVKHHGEKGYYDYEH